MAIELKAKIYFMTGDFKECLKNVKTMAVLWPSSKVNFILDKMLVIVFTN